MESLASLAWYTDNMVVVNKNNKSYFCINAILTATHLEWMFQNEAIVFNEDNTIEFNHKMKNAFISVKEIDKSDNFKTGTSFVRYDSEYKVSVKDRIMTQPIFKNQRLYHAKYNGDYIAHTICVLYYIISSVKNELIIKRDDIEVRDEKMRSFLETNTHGDIYKYENNKLNIHKSVIIEIIKNSDKSYNIVIGYPDNYVMTHPEIYDDILQRQELTNDVLIKKFFNLVSNPKYNKFTDDDIKNNENLWKIATLDNHFDYEHLKTCYDKNAEPLIEFFHKQAHNYIYENKLLNQINIRIKYFFQIFTLMIDKDNQIHIAPTIESIYNINSNHTKLLEKVNDIIDENMVNHVYPNIINKKNNIRKYSKFSDFFHIVAEYINPMTSFNNYNYKTFNVMYLEELIYNSTLKNNHGSSFWNSVSLNFNMMNNAIQEPTISRFLSGIYGGNDVLNLSEISNFLKVILFEIEPDNTIKTILAHEEIDNVKFYLMKIIPNIANCRDKLVSMIQDNNQFDIQYLSNTQKIVIPHYIQNLPLFKIVECKLIDEHNDELYNTFFKFNPCMKLNIKLTSKINEVVHTYPITIEEKKYINPNNIITNVIKKKVLLMYLKKNSISLNDDNFMKDLTEINFDVEKEKYIRTKNYSSISNLTDKKNLHMIWIINNVTYDDLTEIIKNIFKKGNVVDNLNKNYFGKLMEIKKCSNHNKFIKTIVDVNKENCQEISHIIKLSIFEEKYNIYFHTFTSFSFSCLHLRIVYGKNEVKNFGYIPLSNHENKLTINSRNLNFFRFVDYINVEPSYYTNFILCPFVFITFKSLINQYIYNTYVSKKIL